MNYNDYENRLPYTLPEDSPLRKAVVEARKAAEQAGQAVVDAQNKIREAYRQETYRLEGQFQKDALEELGLTGHPKAQKLFEMAWEKGHSDGLSQVFEWMESLKDLVD